MKIGIVTADFNQQITHKMRERAVEQIEDAGHKAIQKTVPGAFDIPYGVLDIIGSVDGVVTLGAIIKGETDHDQVIGYAVTNALQNIMTQHKKPIGLGIIGPGATIEQAEERAFDHTERAVDMVLGELKK